MREYERRRMERLAREKKVRNFMIVCGIAVLVLLVAGLIFAFKNYSERNKKSSSGIKSASAGEVVNSAEAHEQKEHQPDKITVAATPSPSPDPRPVYEVPVFTKTAATVSLPADPDPLNYEDMLELTPAKNAAKPYDPEIDDDIQKVQFINSSYAILVDLETGNIVAERDADKIISPASMTKVLTVLTAMDYLTEEDLDKTYTITQEIVDYALVNECSAVGYQKDMEITVRELIYGTILCSGADAALALAEYVAGSQEAFVELMNKRAEEFGISSSAHFTNVVGLYDENLHCKVGDMAVILACAMQNEFLAEVLNTRKCNSSVITESGEAEEISNWFLRRIEDKETNGNVIAAKTGFVDEAGCCAVSMLETPAGRRYICVTGNAYSSWRCIYDHTALYRCFTE